MITSCFSDTVQDHFRRAVPNPDDIPKTFNGFFTKLDDIFNTSLDLIKKFDTFLAASTAGATRKHSTPEQALAHINIFRAEELKQGPIILRMRRQLDAL